MATVTDVEVANASFPNVRQDLNDILEALATNFSADAEPTTTYPNQFWYETDTNLLYIRNEANDAWVTLASINQTTGEWEPRTAVIQAIDSAGIALKTDDGTTRFSISDAGVVSFENYAFPSADGTAGQVLSTDGSGTLTFEDAGAGDKIEEGNSSVEVVDTGTGRIEFTTDGSEAARIDSSGNLLVGKTTPGLTNDGIELRANNQIFGTADEAAPLALNRRTSDGDIAIFRKDNSTVGTIGVANGEDININGSNGDITFSINGSLTYTMNAARIIPEIDNNNDLGDSSNRYDDVHATNGTIQTSDRNEKQDIEELSEAERNVAVAAKALLRKFRWKSAVEKKDNNPESDETARVHFGIIAQDLQAAFEAEGLDAGRYAMFISSTWWETQTEVPAVEEELDEEGNVVVEAKEAYTRTDTYETEEEAPEGAVKKSRMGVRYSELLAFIIAAI